MINSRYRILTLVVILVMYDTNLFAQAWTKNKGGLYAQIGYSYVSGNKKYSPDGSVQLPYSVQDFTYAAYLEYGLTDKLTLVGNIPFRVLKTSGEKKVVLPSGSSLIKGSLNALGNIEVSAVYNILKSKNTVVSGKIRLGLPSATYEDATGLRTGYDSYGVAPFVNIGYSKQKVFSSLQLGINFRGNSYSEQLMKFFEIGTKIGNKLYLIAGHEFQLSMRNGNYDDENTVYTGLSANNLEYLAYNVKFGYNIKESVITWLYLSGGYWGNEVLKSPAISLSISYELR